ncbi:hypothetical protein C4B60_08035 [Jeotgalibacillus proteolyticus]|uniref:Uncharacterized protein n=1 Tax=Jeotgalibacillus proteolyticus TaxID=2082395 RepID=A0A2S5GCV6_9BACL|nr:hypothetical protein C4B60_08035 [Jeotgalibacillus proteolyticus]
MNYFSAKVKKISGKKLPYQVRFDYQGPAISFKNLENTAAAQHIHIGYEKKLSLFSSIKKLVFKREEYDYELRLFDASIEDQYRYQHEVPLKTILSGKKPLGFETKIEADYFTQQILEELNLFAQTFEHKSSSPEEQLSAK